MVAPMYGADVPKPEGAGTRAAGMCGAGVRREPLSDWDL